jgi:excisionase family DNA binding protein
MSFPSALPGSHQQQRLEPIRQAAERNGVHPRTIRRAITRGELTGYRFGGRIVRVAPDEVDALFRPIATTGGDPNAGAA